jgi:hypothetical protein
MAHPCGVKAVQARLGHDHWPLGMAAPRLLQRIQYHVLNRVRHLHRDKH